LSRGNEMYCILVTGIPASGKSTIARMLSKKLNVPMISKDDMKEILFDDLGFNSREEKVKLGVASMDIMYYVAAQLMEINKPFVLEKNFEHSSREGLMSILEKYSYKAITVTLTGGYEIIYERYAKRNDSPERHRGHVVNDCYPEKESGRIIPPIPYEWFVGGIKNRGMDTFVGNGPRIIVDTTYIEEIDINHLINEVNQKVKELFK